MAKTERLRGLNLVCSLKVSFILLHNNYFKACGIHVVQSTLDQLNEYLNNDREVKNKEDIDVDNLCKVMK